MDFLLKNFMFCLVLLGSSLGIANCECKRLEDSYIECPKTYVQPDQIEFSNNSIFVKLGEWVLQTNSIYQDSAGLFFVNVRDDDCGAAQWKCMRKISKGIYCNACNWVWENSCYLCGKSR